MNPESYTLEIVNWQFFGTLTYKKERMPERVRMTMLFSWLRKAAENFRVHFPKLIWVVRQERGETFGRLHHHVLIAGLPKGAVNTSTCFALMRHWEKLGGGFARVTMYSSRLDGVGYVLKGLEENADRASGDFYETRKFGNRCDVMLSKSIRPVLAGRRSIGQRRPSSTTQGDAGNTVRGSESMLLAITGATPSASGHSL